MPLELPAQACRVAGEVRELRSEVGAQAVERGEVDLVLQGHVGLEGVAQAAEAGTGGGGLTAFDGEGQLLEEQAELPVLRRDPSRLLAEAEAQTRLIVPHAPLPDPGRPLRRAPQYSTAPSSLSSAPLTTRRRAMQAMQ